MAAGEHNSEAATQALNRLCSTYWLPVYSFVRRRGYSVADAQDLTQSFFVQLLKRNFFQGVVRERGRFRAFLLTSLKNFLIDEWEKNQAEKRGGQYEFVSWDVELAERHYQNSGQTELSPEKFYDRQWVNTLLDKVLQHLEERMNGSGMSGRFEKLKQFLPMVRTTQTEADYSRVAAELGMTVGALRTAIFRMRRQFHELFREEILHTLADPADLQQEIGQLLRIYSD